MTLQLVKRRSPKSAPISTNGYRRSFTRRARKLALVMLITPLVANAIERAMNRAITLKRKTTTLPEIPAGTQRIIERLALTSPRASARALSGSPIRQQKGR